MEKKHGKSKKVVEDGSTEETGSSNGDTGTGSVSEMGESVKGKTELTPASRPRKKKGKMNAAPSESTRMLILFRNAEQMNKIFPEWTLKNFIEGNYIPTDMNQPIELPLRNNPMVAFKLDPPLTEMGIRIAQLVGKSLIESGIKVTAIYSSPSLRCIQTAQHLMKAQPHELQIQIEPAFYDFAGHKGKEIPIFMSNTELAENNFPIDQSYRPFTSVTDLPKFITETPAEFSKRQSNNIYNLTKRSPNGTVLIVTHACTIHATGRGLIGKTRHSFNNGLEMLRVPFNYPYCSGVAFKPSPDGRWNIAPSSLPSFNFSHFSSRFNHHFFAKNN